MPQNSLVKMQTRGESSPDLCLKQDFLGGNQAKAHYFCPQGNPHGVMRPARGMGEKSLQMQDFCPENTV